MGRRTSTLYPTPQAAQRLREAQDIAEMTNEEVMAQLRISERTLRRWRNGEKGPTPKAAGELAKLLGAPDLASIWPAQKPVVTIDASSAAGPAAGDVPTISTPPISSLDARAEPGDLAQHGNSRWKRPRRAQMVGGVLVFSFVAAGVGIGLTRDGDNPPSVPPPSSQASPISTPQTGRTAGATPADLPTGTVATLRVDGRMGTQLGHTFSLWTMPSTDTGCTESTPCWEGTQRAAVVKHRQRIQISCVTEGQKIQNGVGAGSYRDSQWLLVAEAQDLGQPPGQRVWISNVWLAREKLPSDVPEC